MEEKARRPGKDAGASFVSGAVSGILTSVILQPFDVVKTHLQANRPPAGGDASTLRISGSGTRGSTSHIVAALYRKEGLRAFWRGSGPSALRVGVGAGLYFTFLDFAFTGMRHVYAKTPAGMSHPVQVAAVEPGTRQMESSSPVTNNTSLGSSAEAEMGLKGPVHKSGLESSEATKGTAAAEQKQVDLPAKPIGQSLRGATNVGLPASVTVGAGALARSLAATMVFPVTVVKTRMEYSAVTGILYRNTWQALTSIYSAEGFRGLFNGLWPTLARDAPYSGLYVLMYEQARKKLREQVLPRESPQVVVNLAAGALAGSGATLLTHPPDVVRTRMQLQHIEFGRGSHHLSSLDNPRLRPIPASMWATGKELWQAEGVRGYFKGVIPRMLKRGISQACSWTIYEEMRRLLTGRSIWVDN